MACMDFIKVFTTSTHLITFKASLQYFTNILFALVCDHIQAVSSVLHTHSKHSVVIVPILFISISVSLLAQASTQTCPELYSIGECSSASSFRDFTDLLIWQRKLWFVTFTCKLLYSSQPHYLSKLSQFYEPEHNYRSASHRIFTVTRTVVACCFFEYSAQVNSSKF